MIMISEDGLTFLDSSAGEARRRRKKMTADARRRPAANAAEAAAGNRRDNPSASADSYRSLRQKDRASDTALSFLTGVGTQRSGFFICCEFYRPQAESSGIRTRMRTIPVPRYVRITGRQAGAEKRADF